MKYSALLLVLGALSFTEAKQSPQLIQIIEDAGMTPIDSDLLALKDADEMNW